MDVPTVTTSPYTMSDTDTPPYLPPSMLAKRLSWDVFLSFRGEDTRHTITKHLYDALQSNGVRVFIDDEGMERGDVIQPSLEEAIVDSALSVAIISPRYADSRWCLEELCKIFNCPKRVIPVFYRVDPSDVRRQKGVFGQGFWSLVDLRKCSQPQVEVWKKALENVGNISGYPCYSDSDEPELIQRIVKQVLGELKNTPEYVVKFAVGLDSRVEEVLCKLCIHSGGVRFLGIHGTPGIGKTTLAKATFNKVVGNFKSRSFISNVREQLANEGGALTIQNKLIRDLSLGSVRSVEHEDDAKREIRKILNEKQVLVVLDDVSEAGQLETLGIVRGWFEEGSRIIVTSRNVGALLEFACNDELHEARKLSNLESLELFSIHALGRREPTQEYLTVAKEIVSLTGGLPLALEVFGSSLVKKSKSEWEDALIKLRELRPDKLQGVLRITYDTLDAEEKTVFLDISCLLLQLNLQKEDVVDILEGCGLRAELAIGNLVTKSLLKVTEQHELWMHDQIRDMGRQIVIEESHSDPGKLSRVWRSCDIRSILRHGKATEAIRGIVLDIPKPPDFSTEKIYWFNFRKHPSIKTAMCYLAERFRNFLRYREDKDDKPILHTKSFKKMANLKLLQINHAKLRGNFKNMPSELRSLQWRGCPRKSLPANIPEEIRVLDVSRSKIQSLWSSDWSYWFSNKVARNLVVINLSRCPSLTYLPDMSGHIHLRKLNLELCVGLLKIHESVGNMSSLVHLNVSRCSNLVDFPREVTGMKGLRDLILSDCSRFRGLPHDVRSMKSLIQLLLDGTATAELPEYLIHLTQLEVLHLNGCRLITSLPEWIGRLINLRDLSLDHTNIGELPASVGSLASLEKLSLMGCSSIVALPDSVGNLKSLAELYLNGTSIQQLPPSICSLSYLVILWVGGCSSLSVLPISIGGLASITELQLDNIPITLLPDQVSSLRFIKKLQMNKCTSLVALPESMGKMSSLETLYAVGAGIKQLPESIGNLENLTWLNLNRCRELCWLPDSIGNLRSLHVLMIEETSITFLPESFGSLESLRVLKMKKLLAGPITRNGSTDPISISTHEQPIVGVLPASFCKLSNLEEFDARACGISGKIRDDFDKLSKLETLNLGYNSFLELPSSLEALCVLKNLSLWHCNKLRSLPRLPSALVVLVVADCNALESICDLSNLYRLQELQLSNCERVQDVPGLECLKSLRRLFMAGCNRSAIAAKRRLSKVTLRNLNNLAIPGSEIPDWFSQEPVNFSTRPNLAIKNVIVAVVVSVNFQMLDDRLAQLPIVMGIQARILRLNDPIFTTTLNLAGVPRTEEDQLYLCRFKEYHPLVSLLQDDDSIQVGLKNGQIQGIELKKWGIFLVFENDDDYDGDEDSLQFAVSKQSVTQRLVQFFRPLDQI